MAQKNQLLAIKNKEEDTDKSIFERFEYELKQTTFGIMFLVLKEEESSIWKALILIIVGELQILTVIFNEAIDFPWKNDSFSKYVRGCFHAFTFTYWCSYSDWTIYLTIFYIGVGLLVLIIISIIYASYLFSSKQVASVWPFQILRIIFSLFITVFYFPLIDLYSSMFKCNNVDGTYRHYIFSSVICFKGVHIAYIVCGIVAYIIFFILSLVVTLCFFESKINSTHPLARTNARNDAWTMVFRTVCNLMFAILLNNSYRWIYIVVFAIGGVALYIKQRMEKAYYNNVINVIIDAGNGVFIWSTIMLIVDMMTEGSSFNGGIQAFLMGVPLVIVFLVTCSDHRKKMLLKGIESYDDGEKWFMKILYYISLIQRKNLGRELSIEIKGFIYSHEEKCTIQNCPLKAYISNDNTLVNDGKRKRQSKTSSENFNYLIRFANLLFTQGISKFPCCTSLRIAYAFFLKEWMSNKTQAINELISAERTHPHFDEQFLIYRYRKTIEDEMADIQTNNQSGVLDAISMLAYDNYLRQFKESTERSAVLHMEFWVEVLEPEPDLGKLDRIGSKIHSSIAIVEDYWEKLQKINANVSKALKMYAEFLTEILNDSEAGGELLARAKDNIVSYALLNATTQEPGETMRMGDMCTALGNSDGTPCIIASGEHGRLGEILQFNLSVCRLFGYTKTELVGKKINSLMPEIYTKVHDKILQHSIDSNEDATVSSRADIFVLAKHRSNYLLPLFLQARMMPSITQGILFAGAFKTEKKGLSACYLLLNKQQDVVGISSRCIATLKLNNRLLKNSRVSFQTLAPSIQDKSALDQYTAEKAGAMIDIFLPEENADEYVDNTGKHDGSFSEVISYVETPVRNVRVKASKDLIKFSCIITEIRLMDELAGYLVRLDSGYDNDNLLRIEKVNKYPNIQFIFDPVNMRYNQEDCVDDAQKRIAEETSEYVSIIRDRSYSNVTPVKSDEGKSPDTSVIQGDDVTQLHNVLNKKKMFGENITVRRLVNGEEVPVIANSRLIEKQLEEVRNEENATRREKNNEKKEDIFQSSLKSKKAFNAALNERSIPSSIKKLRLTGYVVSIIILALTSIEFALVITNFRDIDENLYMVKYSRLRIAVQMKLVFYISKQVFAHRDYDPRLTAFKDINAKAIIGNSLDTFYSLQDKLAMSKLPMSAETHKFYDEKSVALYYKTQTEGVYDEKNYTLNEAVQQFASEVFTIQSITDESKYATGNDDIDFIVYNGFADFYTKISKSAALYVKELNNHENSKRIMLYILYAVAIAICVGNIIFIFPGVADVSGTRLGILSLFLDIPQNNVRTLANKADHFIAKSSNEVMDDAASSEGEVMIGSSELVLEGLDAEKPSRIGKRRIFKNNTTSNTKFYLQYLFAVLVMIGYFSISFTYGFTFLNDVSKYNQEINAISKVLQETASSFAMFQELLGNRKLMLYTEDETFELLAYTKIPLMYSIASEIQNSHNDNQNSFKDTYKETFINVMRSNLCNLKTKFNFSFSDCEKFLDATIIEGLHPVIVKYIEQLREELTNYDNITATVSEDLVNFTITNELLNSTSFLVMEQAVFEVIDFSVKYLIDALIDSYSYTYDSKITLRIILFVCFLMLYAIAFLSLWMIFINQLNEKVTFNSI